MSFWFFLLLFINYYEIKKLAKLIIFLLCCKMFYGTCAEFLFVFSRDYCPWKWDENSPDTRTYIVASMSAHITRGLYFCINIVLTWETAITGKSCAIKIFTKVTQNGSRFRKLIVFLSNNLFTCKDVMPGLISNETSETARERSLRNCSLHLHLRPVCLKSYWEVENVGFWNIHWWIIRIRGQSEVTLLIWTLRGTFIVLTCSQFYVLKPPVIPEKVQPRTGMFENGIFRVLRSTEQRVTATFFEDLVRGRRFLFLAFSPAEIKKLNIEIGC